MSRSAFAVCLTKQTIATEALNALEQLQMELLAAQRTAYFYGEAQSPTLLFSGNSLVSSDFALYVTSVVYPPPPPKNPHNGLTADGKLEFS